MLEAQQNSANNIILIGLPGAGKSTLGVVLAKILNYSFVDGDILIQERMGKTLQNLIDQLGASGFLEVENQVLSSIQCTRSIIATGGSAVYSAEAMEHLQSIGIVVHLKVAEEELVNRLGDLDERGVVLRNGRVAQLHDLYEERMPLYRKYAQITVDVTSKQVREAAKELEAALIERGAVAN